MIIPTGVVVLGLIILLVLIAFVLILVCALSKRPANDNKLTFAETLSANLQRQMESLQKELTEANKEIATYSTLLVEYENDKAFLAAQYVKVSNEYAWFRIMLRETQPDAYSAIKSGVISAVKNSPASSNNFGRKDSCDPTPTPQDVTHG